MITILMIEKKMKFTDLNIVIKILKDENDNVRSRAAYAFGEIKDARAVEPLMEALKDEDIYVREAAKAAL